MIRGKVSDTKKYENIRINKAIEWLKSVSKNIEKGIYEIEGKEIYAIVQNYNSKKYEELKWEGHRKYIDIQYILSGKESMGYSNIKNMNEICEYNEEGDYQFFSGNGEIEEVNEGEFVIFAPEDIHMPCIGDGSFVTKIVVMVRV